MSTVSEKPAKKTTVTKVVKAKDVKTVEPKPEGATVKKVVKKKTLPVTEEKPVVAPVQRDVVVEQPTEQKVEDQTVENKDDDKLSRKKKNFNQLISDVDNLSVLVDKYVKDHKEDKNNDMSKFLKNLEKGLKRVKIQVQKLGKNKNSSATNTNVQSGFQKPVKISQAVASFTGWDAEQPRARVEVTNYVCEYIKEHNLQNPEDRRKIVADEKLSSLLDYNQERDGSLTYATIQKLLAKHYSPVQPTA
jgi:chromatin remodeling complex protein RSC6